MLGLRRGAVCIAAHDPAWADQFRRTAEGIGAATGIPAERIQHVGSTAVPGLPAKPILDIDVGLVESEDLEKVAAGLARIGYLDRGNREGGTGRLLVWETAPDFRTVHVHIIPHHSAGWRRDLAFRDALLADSALREQYGELKTRLADLHPNDRRAYRHARTTSLMNWVLPHQADRARRSRTLHARAF